MQTYDHQMLVPVVLEERRRAAPPRRARRTGRLVRGAGGGLVALGTALAATGRRLQEPTPGPGCAFC